MDYITFTFKSDILQPNVVSPNTFYSTSCDFTMSLGLLMHTSRSATLYFMLDVWGLNKESLR